MLRKKEKDCYGLCHSFAIAPTLCAIVVTNVDKPDGLTNGAYGVVRAIDSQQRVVWVQFDVPEIGQKVQSAWANSHHEQTLVPELDSYTAYQEGGQAVIHK